MKQVLVCGGAGYIGAHMVKRLVRDGYGVTVFDNLSTGHRAAVQNVELIEGDLLDNAALVRLFAAHKFDAVMHFCALSVVAESVRDPYTYYRNNVVGTLNLLDAMRAAGIDRFIFSSTASVYGNPVRDVVDETHPTHPINPYGASKLMVERMLEDAARTYGLRCVALRYFNAVGADPEGDIGESHTPETHLVPNVLRSILNGAKTPLQIFGNDYDTRDGTCVRDYVHVNDLADAHLLAMQYIDSHEGARCFNLGSGTGYSVLEVIEAARKVTGKKIVSKTMPRREGDPPVLVADCSRAIRELGWRPACSDLETMVGSAWRWHSDPGY